MGQIIYSDIQEEKHCVRFYKGKIYYAERGGIFALCRKKKCKLAEHNVNQRCVNAIINDDKLYYFFEEYIDIIENDIVSSFEFDLRNIDVVEIRNETLYYVKEGYVIESNIAGNVKSTISLKNAVKSQVIKVINKSFILVGDSKGTLWLVDIAKQKSKQFKLHSDSIQDICVKNDCIVTVSRDKRIKKSVLDLNHMNIIQKRISDEFGHFINCVVQDENEYYIGLSDGTLVCIDEQFEIKIRSKIHSDAIRLIQKMNDGKWMTFSDDGMIYLVQYKQNRWEIVEKNGKLSDKIQCSCLANRKIYLGFRSGKIKEIDPLSGDKKDICKISNVRSMCKLNDNILICGTENGSLYFVQIQEGHSKLVAKRGSTPYSLTFNTSRNELFVGRRDGTIESYSVCIELNTELKKLKSIKTHLSIVGDIVDTGDGLFTCSDDQSIKILDYNLNTVSSMLSTAHNTAINNLIVTSRYILASSDNGYVYRIDKENTDQKRAFSMFDIPVRALYLSDDNILYVGDRQGNVYTWDFDKFAMGLYQGTSRVVTILEVNDQKIIIFEDSVIKLDLEVEKMKKKEKVFIIHGKNNELKREVQLLLERVGIEGIVLHERADKGRTIIDKLIEEAEPAIYAIAILTPDDVVDSAFRARQNVYLEAGYFLGKLGKSRVLLLKLGDIEIPSDLQGILYTDVDDVVNGYWKSKVIKELVSAGFNVDMSELIKII